MNIKNKLLMLFIVVGSYLLTEQVNAQQDAQYTQYMYNTISVNPGYAGSRGVMSIMGLYRSQWIGLDGAPTTQTLTINSPIGRSNRMGLGISAVNDNIGPTDETFFAIDFSYTIPVSEGGKLSFGVKAGGHLLNVDFQKLNQFGITQNQIDNTFNNPIGNKFSPNFGIGLYYHTKKSYIGLSAPNVLETEHFDESVLSEDANATTLIAKERINYYLIAGHVFTLSSDFKLKPAILSKLVFGSALQVDVSANLLMYDRVTLGLAYRWSAALSALAGFQINDSLFLGIAYDRETTELVQFNNGSFEVMLRFDLFKKYDKYITPRFF